MEENFANDDLVVKAIVVGATEKKSIRMSASTGGCNAAKAGIFGVAAAALLMTYLGMLLVLTNLKNIIPGLLKKVRVVT